MDKWIQIKATFDVKYLDEVCAVMSMVDNSLMIEDYSDVERDLDGVYGDLIDEELLKKDKTKAAVSVFIPEIKSPVESVGFVRQHLADMNINAQVEQIGVSEEDWADSWKKYYKPIKTGKRIVIVPVWEDYQPEGDELTVLMDPGMAFGTGTHETTRLCASLLEKYEKPGDIMLDVGCGSGILAICAAKLGAEECFACDIDQNAVRIANENAKLNNTPCVKAEVSDLLRQVKKREGGYDICCANIVADVIIRMAPDIGEYISDNGSLIVSGIITERMNETVNALEKCGWKLVDSMTERGWFAGVLQKAK